MSLELLIRLSMKSAIELDRLAQGLSVDERPLKEFADQLKTASSSTADSASGARFLADPYFTFACTKALTAVGERNGELFNVPTKINAITDDLRKVVGGDHSDLGKLKEFCLLLHNNLLSEEMGTIETRRRSRGDHAKVALA